MGQQPNGVLPVALQEAALHDDPPAQILGVIHGNQPRSLNVEIKRVALIGVVAFALLFSIHMFLYCYHPVSRGRFTEEDATKNWDPRSLPRMQESPPWLTWRNRSADVRFPRILQWASEQAQISGRSAEAWPSNPDLSFERLVNVTSCATPSENTAARGHCAVTARHDLLFDSDAVVFNGGDFTVDGLPHLRAALQMWVFWDLEWPPKNESHIPLFLTLEGLPTLFNWTMSWREDSDVRIPSKVWRLGAMARKKEGTLKKERSAVAWIASEREQSRSRTALQMLSVNVSSAASNRVKLHILTRCAHGQCLYSTDCMRRVADAYRFVFVELWPDCFESAYNVIYEAFKYDIVPVVLVPPNVTLDLPPNSVINSAEFQQPGQLATFLRDTMADANKYESFFSWKRKYHVADLEDLMCPLCVALLEHPMRPGDRLDLKEWHIRRTSSPDKPLYGVDDSFEEIGDQLEGAEE